MPSDRDPTSIDRRKRRLFTAAMLLLPLIFFVLLEVGLRLGGYGGSWPLFEPVPGYEQYRYQNREVARRYFHGVENVPTGLSDAFRAEKDSSILRIVVQGGSSAAGYPYYYGGSFSRMLEQRLQQTLPDRTIEVINTALAAVNSYTLRDFVDEILEIEPDAVLIYAGHNEYYGALGVGSSESFGRHPAVVNLYLGLQNLRIMQGLRDLLSSIASRAARRESGAPPPATLMERMVGEQTIPYGSNLYHAGLRQFETNLDAILGAYADAGVPVYISTIASNERDQPPFIGGPDAPPEAYSRAMNDAGQALTSGRTEDAFDALTNALNIDSTADALYLRARTLDRLGRPAEAAADFTAAKDRDQLRFRAPEDVNRILRESAAESGAHVVEARQHLIDRSERGVVGHDLMLEHLHPNLDGYFLIADAFYDALRRSSFSGRWDRFVTSASARRELLLTEIDSLYGAYRVRQLTAAWPFAPPGSSDRSLDTLRGRTTAERLALDVLRSEKNWFEATDSLRAWHVSQGNLHEALKATLATIQQYPFLPQPYARAGEILANQGRLPEARVYMLAALDRGESAAVLSVLGDINRVLGRTEEAESNLQRALELRPGDVETMFRLAMLFASTDRSREAAELTMEILSREPEHRGAVMLADRLGVGPSR